MDLGEIRARIASLHTRRLNSPLDAEELGELRALYEQEHEAQRVPRPRGADAPEPPPREGGRGSARK